MLLLRQVGKYDCPVEYVTWETIICRARQRSDGTSELVYVFIQTGRGPSAVGEPQCGDGAGTQEANNCSTVTYLSEVTPKVTSVKTKETVDPNEIMLSISGRDFGESTEENRLIINTATGLYIASPLAFGFGFLGAMTNVPMLHGVCTQGVC